MYNNEYMEVVKSNVKSNELVNNTQSNIDEEKEILHFLKDIVLVELHNSNKISFDNEVEENVNIMYNEYAEFLEDNEVDNIKERLKNVLENYYYDNFDLVRQSETDIDDLAVKSDNKEGGNNLIATGPVIIEDNDEEDEKENENKEGNDLVAVGSVIIEDNGDEIDSSFNKEQVKKEEEVENNLIDMGPVVINDDEEEEDKVEVKEKSFKEKFEEARNNIKENVNSNNFNRTFNNAKGSWGNYISTRNKSRPQTASRSLR